MNPTESEANLSPMPDLRMPDLRMPDLPMTDSPGMMRLRRVLAVILGVLGLPFLLAFVLGILALAHGDVQVLPTLAGGGIGGVVFLLAYLVWGAPEPRWLQRSATVWLPRALAMILSGMALPFLLAFLLGIFDMGRGGPPHIFIPLCAVMATWLYFLAHSLWIGAGIPLWIRRGIVIAILSGQSLYCLFELWGWLRGGNIDWLLLIAVHLVSLWCRDVYFLLWSRNLSGSMPARGAVRGDHSWANPE